MPRLRRVRGARQKNTADHIGSADADAPTRVARRHIQRHIQKRQTEIVDLAHVELGSAQKTAERLGTLIGRIEFQPPREIQPFDRAAGIDHLRIAEGRGLGRRAEGNRRASELQPVGAGIQRHLAAQHGSQHHAHLRCAAGRPENFDGRWQRATGRLCEGLGQFEFECGKAAVDAQRTLARRFRRHSEHTVPIRRTVDWNTRRQRERRMNGIPAQRAVEHQQRTRHRRIARRPRLHLKRSAQYFAVHIGMRHLCSVDIRIAVQIGGRQCPASGVERHAVQMRMHEYPTMAELFERQKQVHVGLHRSFGLDAGKRVLRHRIQRSGPQIVERRGCISARCRMYLQLGRFEIDEAGIALIKGETADISLEQLDGDAFVAKFSRQCEILRPWPALPVVERNAVDMSTG